MANGRLIEDCVKLQKAGAELINVIKSSKKVSHQPYEKIKQTEHF